MIVALIDNGSLEPAAHRNLRQVAGALSARTDTKVHAVSWKHSDRIAAADSDGAPAWTLGPFVRTMHALGQRDFLFIPFFVSPQGAIGSALHGDLERLRAELAGLDFDFTAGLAADDTLAAVVADRIRALRIVRGRARPPVVVVDHGGPSSTSARVRQRVTEAVRSLIGGEVGPIVAASMEGSHPPLLAEQLRAPGFAGADVVVAPLFLSPGRHAGPDGDIARICAASPARVHLADLVGTHPLVIEALAAALLARLSSVHADPLAATPA